MTFDETQTITLTQEQARIHMVALSVCIERMKKRSERLDERIAEHRSNGEMALGLKKAEAKKPLSKKVAKIQQELDRMREIFGDLNNGKSNN